MHTTSTWYGSSRYSTHRRVQIGMVQRLQETEYGRKRIQIAEKREREAKEETEKGKKLRVPELPEVQPQANPGGPASGSGIKRPAQDPPEDPRLEPDPSETQLDTPMEDGADSAQPSRGTKRDADAAGVSVEPMDDETAITNLLLSHRKGFLGALHAKLQESPEVCQFVRNNLTLTLKHFGIKLRPKYRSRLVPRELKVKSGQSETHCSHFFASMPPITALRILFTIVVTKKIPNKDGKLIPLDPTTCLIFIDIKKEHFWSLARRRLLVKIPPEMGCPPGMVGLLKKSLYGTRDAPANWEAGIKDVMLALGFLQAKSNACLYFHEGRNIRIEVHGDDFTGVGRSAINERC